MLLTLNVRQRLRANANSSSKLNAYRYATPSGRRLATRNGLEYSEPPVSECINHVSSLSDEYIVQLHTEHVSRTVSL